MKLGASNKFFYYTSSYTSNFTLNLTLTFARLDLPAFREAVREALSRYPEFRYRPAVKDNRLVALENDAEPRFVTAEEKRGKQFCYGTGDTAGYLFYFLTDGNSVTLSYYHALTDVIGMMEWMRCALYLYARKTGFELTETELAELLPTFRQSADDFAQGDAEDLLDPYRRHGDVNAVPEYAYQNPGAFEIPTPQYPKEDDGIHCHMLEMSVSEVLKKSRALGVSVVPMLNDIFSLSIRGTFGAGDRPVIAMLPVNLRGIVGSSARVNCSDGVLLPFTREDEALPMEERCARWKQLIRGQMTPAFAKHTMGAKAAAVDAFEADPAPIAELAKKKTVLTTGGFRPVTYALTYPGKISFLSGLDRMLDDVAFLSYARASCLIGHSFGDRMAWQILCRNDEKVFPEGIRDAVAAAGLSAKLTDRGVIHADKMIIDRLNYID